MKVFRLFVVLAASLLFAGVAMAQETPTVEAFAGYTFIHFNGGSGSLTVTPVGAAPRLGARQLAGIPPGGVDPTLTSNINGGSGSIAYNFNQWFGMAADLGGSAVSRLNLSGVGGADVSSSLFTYLFGPRISYRKNKTFTPFAQVLVGGAHITDVTLGGTKVANGENAFAMTAGGGLDWNVTKMFAVRLGQVEYLLTRFRDPFSLTGASGTQNNFRYSGGVVFRFGERK